MRSDRLEEPVDRSGYHCGVVRGAQIQGKMMGALELLCENLCFALGVINLYTLVGEGGDKEAEGFVKYRAMFQNWKACGCKEPRKEDHLELRRRVKLVEKTRAKIWGK